MLMRDDQRVERPAAKPKVVEQSPEASLLRSAVDQDAAPTVLDKDCVPLADIENAHDETRGGGRRRLSWLGDAAAGCNGVRSSIARRDRHRDCDQPTESSATKHHLSSSAAASG
jgi:hypothetical protein